MSTFLSSLRKRNIRLALLDLLPSEPSRPVLLATLLALSLILAFAPLWWLPPLIAAGFVGVWFIRYPWFIWVVIGAVLPWTSGMRLGIVSLTDCLFLLAIVLWFGDAVRRRHVHLHISTPAIAALAYVFMQALSTLNAEDFQGAISEIAKWTQFAIVLLILPTMINAKDHVPWLVGGIFLGATGQAILGIYQFYFRVGPEWFMIQDQYMRAAGTFGQPNPYGAYMGLTLPVTISVLSWFSVRPIRKRRLNWRDLTGWTIARTLVFLVGAGVVVSWSRGAWLGAVAAAVLIFWLSSSRLVRILSVTLIIFIIVVGAATPLLSLVPPEILARFSELPGTLGLGASLDQEITDENFAILERLAFWQAALNMWAYAPWFGVGPGNFDAYYGEFGLARWQFPLGHAHNIYLNTLAETGIMGFISFIILWISVTVVAARGFRTSRRSNRWQAALSVGVLGVVTHLAVHSLFDNLFVQGMFLHLSLWIAILLSLQASSQDREHLAKVNQSIV